MSEHHQKKGQQRAALNLSQRYVLPTSEIEKALAEIWQKLLDIDQVGIHDDFFELGGDSIALIQVATQLQKRGIFLDPGQLFQVASLDVLASQATAQSAQALKVPTIAELASMILLSQTEMAERGSTEHLLEQIDQLSPEEIDLLLERFSIDEEDAHE